MLELSISSNGTPLWNDSFEFIVHPIGVLRENRLTPDNYSLSQNHPNPFNPLTSINFSVPRYEDVTLIIYDLLGKEIIRLVDGELPAGTHKTVWDAFNYPSGLYFYRLRAGDFAQTKKMMLLK